MHSFWYRLNTVITISALLLALLCSLASLSDTLNLPSVDAQVEVLKVNRFRKQLTGNDEVTLTLNVSADLQSTFTWNTKQIQTYGGIFRHPNGIPTIAYRHTLQAVNDRSELILAAVIEGLREIDKWKNKMGNLAFKFRRKVSHEAAIYIVFVFLAAEYETSKNSLNQISLWDHIIQDKDQAKIQKQVPTKYPLVDQGHNLRGKLIKFVLHWYIMPKTGRTIKDKSIVSEFRLPEVYT
ncbi:hypothetical protein GIB67_012675 [Kingdonia uniflora]|uniref:Signal peptidase complex subunit 3 n=1 Tax=Kingdonia uniflora TaxID=39325 RepID=A0A7J7NFY2_9MAGN|nr:hypothetical protein GIB67_012675 [Kingdonia uniflora]